MQRPAGPQDRTTWPQTILPSTPANPTGCKLPIRHKHKAPGLSFWTFSFNTRYIPGTKIKIQYPSILLSVAPGETKCLSNFTRLAFL